MRHKRKNFIFLLLGILSLAAFFCLVNFFSPDFAITLYSFQLSIFYIFFALLFILLFALGSYFLQSKKQGILIATFFSAFLLFRLNNLTHPFFVILLTALFLTLELLFTYKK
ncbi:MAG TPA: hypothetical protein VF810_04175 [Patescibacteria group bacterium]